MPAESVRSFVALPCPPRLRAAIAGAPWRASTAPIRWTDATRAHLTLRFLGAARLEQLERLDQGLARAAAATAPLTLRAGPTGAFPDWRRPRVLWLGLESGAELPRLAAVVEETALAAGFPAADHDFTAHLTLGRVKGSRELKEAVDRVRAWRAEVEPEAIREVVLYRSDPASGGPRYTALARHVLGGAG